MKVPADQKLLLPSLLSGHPNDCKTTKQVGDDKNQKENPVVVIRTTSLSTLSDNKKQHCSVCLATASTQLGEKFNPIQIQSNHHVVSWTTNPYSESLLPSPRRGSVSFGRTVTCLSFRCHSAFERQTSARRERGKALPQGYGATNARGG